MSVAPKIVVVATRASLHPFICVRPLIVVAPHHEGIAHPYCRKAEARIYLPFNTQGIHVIAGGTVCSFEIARSGSRSGAPFVFALLPTPLRCQVNPNLYEIVMLETRSRSLDSMRRGHMKPCDRFHHLVTAITAGSDRKITPRTDDKAGSSRRTLQNTRTGVVMRTTRSMLRMNPYEMAAESLPVPARTFTRRQP
jgi:hypothetical protein